MKGNWGGVPSGTVTHCKPAGEGTTSPQVKAQIAALAAVTGLNSPENAAMANGPIPAAKGNGWERG